MEMGAAENRSLGEKGKGGVVKVIKKEKARIDRVVESSRGLPWFPLRFSVFFFLFKILSLYMDARAPAVLRSGCQFFARPFTRFLCALMMWTLRVFLLA